MLKLILFCSTFSFTFLAVASDAMIGPGKWKMLKMEKKTGLADKFEFDIVQRKYNRTHDMFLGSMNFHEDLNEMFGARIEVCKYVDGGCKQYQVLSDDSFGNLVGKYAEENFKDMLAVCGAETTDFPVPMGKYEIEQYIWNWDTMPEEGPYGQYSADCCVMEATKDVGCLTVELIFEEIEEDEEE